VASPADDPGGELVLGGHGRSRTHLDRAHGKLGPQVEGVGRPGPGVLEDARVEHLTRPALPLLRGLEAEDDVTAKLVPKIAKQRGGPEEHRHVAVVAAGVHLARHPGAVLPSLDFLNRQGIHVGPQQNGGAGGLRSTQHTDDPRAADLGAHLESQLPEALRDERGGAVLLEAELRVAVEGAAPLHEVVRQSHDPIFQIVSRHVTIPTS